MGRTDFRVKGKIFATLPFVGDEEPTDNVPGGVGVLKFTSKSQDEFIKAWPKCFEPVRGAWGQRGFTRIFLRSTTEAVARKALTAAFQLVSGDGSSTPRKRVGKPR